MRGASREATAVREMFDRIAGRYDLLNRLCSLGLDRGWRRALAANLEVPRGALVLDLATGTGDLARAVRARSPGLRIVGLDCSWPMLARARAKGGLEPVLGWAQALPFAAGSFAAAVCAFGIRNFHPPEPALQELARVLAPGGKLALLEFAMPPHGLWRRLYSAYLGHVVPRLGALLSRREAYAYLDESIRGFLAPAEFARLLSSNGFQSPSLRSLAGGAVVLAIATRGE